MKIKIKNYKIQNNAKWMSQQDLKIVSYAMAKDLSKEIDWE